MTKKEFKQKCRFETYTGPRRKLNAIFFDWKSERQDEKYVVGYKYRVDADTKDCTKKELINIMYDWIYKDIQPPWYVRYEYASTDMDRFKVPLSI